MNQDLNVIAEPSRQAPSRQAPCRVAIVGGGIAGLAAAFSILRARPGTDLQIFESSDRIGGAIQTERSGEFLVEHGADMFATEPRGALRLCEQLGIDGEWILPQTGVHGAAILHRGKLVRIPEGFVLMRPTRLWPMMTTPLLSIAGKLRLLSEPFRRTRGNIEDESIESFVLRRLGRETMERIVQPLVGGIYTGDVRSLSMAAAMPQFWEMESDHGSLFRATIRRSRSGLDSVEKNSAGARYEKFRSFPGGMQRLIDALGGAIPPASIHLSSPVERMRRASTLGDEGRWTLDVNGQPSAPFDHVMVATPARHASKILAECCPVASESLAKIRFASSVVVAVVIRDQDHSVNWDVAGVVVPIIERRQVLAISFTGDKFAGRTPPGYRLIRVFIGGELQADLLRHDDAELVSIAISELRSVIGFTGEPVMTKVLRWTDAMPQYHVGHLRLLDTIDAAISEAPGISLIGNSLRGVGIAPTITHAVQKAQMIVDAATQTDHRG